MTAESEDAGIIKGGKTQYSELEELFPDLFSQIRRYGYRITEDWERGENLATDAFLDLIEKLASGEGPTKNIKNYLFSVVRNAFVDSLRKKPHWAPLDEVECLAMHDPNKVETEAERNILFEKVIEAMKGLSDNERTVINLKYLGGMTGKEIAAETGLSEGNVRAISKRGLEKLIKNFNDF